MPVYEYACDKCGHEFEAEQRITEAPLKTCPAARPQAQRLISQTSFVLKGSGWYADLYSSKAKPDAASGKPEATASKSDSTGEGASAPATGSSDATPPSDPKPKTKREGKPGKSKGSKAAA
jgi:putative FmdB family regulatory protein